MSKDTDKAIEKLRELLDSEDPSTAIYAAKELLKATATKRCPKCDYRLVYE